MKILFANGRMLHPFGVGGDTISTYNLLNFLYDHGHDCNSIGTIDHPPYIKFNWDIKQFLSKLKIRYITCKEKGWSNSGFIPHVFQYEKIRYDYPFPCLLTHKDTLIKNVDYIIRSNRPDIIFTQMELADEIASLAKYYRIPLILFIYDTEKLSFFNLTNIHNSNCVVIYPSIYAEKILSPYHNHTSYQIYQSIRDTDLISDNKLIKNEQKYITMINPVPEKGGDLVYEIIKSMPDNKFLIVEGWKKFRDIKLNFRCLNNVTLMERQHNISNVLSKTRILLMPSQWMECFGRVVIEAEANGIPVIASNRGGIKEAVGPGGIIVDKYSSLESWIQYIRLVNSDKIYYKRLSLAGKKYASRFHINIIGPKIIKICKTIIK